MHNKHSKPPITVYMTNEKSPLWHKTPFILSYHFWWSILTLYSRYFGTCGRVINGGDGKIRIALTGISIKNYFKRWITRLTRRWRTQQSVWIDVKRTTLWSLTFRTHIAAMGQPVATYIWGSALELIVTSNSNVLRGSLCKKCLFNVLGH